MNSRSNIPQKRHSADCSFRNKYFYFIGEVAGDNPDGFGVLYLADGGSLEGNFVSGELKGNGIRRWSDGSIYVGEFREGEPHGSGRLVKRSGEEYEGEFRFGQADGQCHYLHRAQQVTYTGEFRRNLYDGQGTLTTSAFTCCGNFIRGLPHGDVEMHYANDDVYVGPAVHGKPEGGKCYFLTRAGIEYEGPVQDGKRAILPSILVVTQTVIGGIPQIASTTDPFYTLPQHHPIVIRFEVRKRRTAPPPPPEPSGVAPKIPIRLSKQPSPFASKKQSAKEMQPPEVAAVICDPCASESRRKITVRLHQLQSSDPKNLSFDASRCCPFAVSGSTQELQRACARRKATATPTAPPEPSKTPRKALKLSPVVQTQNLLDLNEQQLFMADFDNVFSQECTTEMDVASIEVLPLLVDPGDFILVCELDTASGFQLVPGSSSSLAEVPPIAAEVPLHVVRQC